MIDRLGQGLVDSRWRGGFVGNEAAGFVGAVAEGAFGGMAAAAESDGRLVGWNLEFGAAGVDEPKRTFDDERTMRAEANGDFGHGRILAAGCSFCSPYFCGVVGEALGAGVSSAVNTNRTFQLSLLSVLAVAACWLDFDSDIGRFIPSASAG